MRTLIVSNIDSKKPYGPTTRPFFLGSELASGGAQVYQLGLNCEMVDYGPSASTHSRGLRTYVGHLRNAVAAFEPDVIYAHQNLPGAAACISRRLYYPTIKVVLDFHSSPAFEYKSMLVYYDRRVIGWLRYVRAYLIERWLTSQGLPIIAASRELGRQLIEWYHVPPDRIYTVPNGVRPSLLEQPISVHDPYREGVGHPVALAIAPGSPYSPNALSVKFIAQVAHHLQRMGRTMQIVVLGEGQFESAPNVTYAGFVPDLQAYIDHADLCLLPYPKEAICGGVRNKAVEFLARKKLVISTQEGIRGIEGCQHNHHLRIVADDPAEFGAEMIRVLDNHEAWRYLGENGYELVRDKYNWRILAAQVRHVLAETE